MAVDLEPSSEVKGFHSMFAPRSKQRWVLQAWCPVQQQQWAVAVSGCPWGFLQKQGKVLKPGDKAEHEIFL